MKCLLQIFIGVSLLLLPTLSNTQESVSSSGSNGFRSTVLADKVEQLEAELTTLNALLADLKNSSLNATYLLEQRIILAETDLSSVTQLTNNQLTSVVNIENNIGASEISARVANLWAKRPLIATAVNDLNRINLCEAEGHYYDPTDRHADVNGCVNMYSSLTLGVYAGNIRNHMPPHCRSISSNGKVFGEPLIATPREMRERPGIIYSTPVTLSCQGKPGALQENGEGWSIVLKNTTSGMSSCVQEVTNPEPCLSGLPGFRSDKLEEAKRLQTIHNEYIGFSYRK